jgi:release factor glutamine methyltransferase
LAAAGCVAADEEAVELLEAAGGDAARVAELVRRRSAGEPLAWLVGSVRFCGETVLVHPGVYVPRWQSEPMALEAAARLPDGGIAVDLCTGSGAIAVVLARARPGATVLATEIDPLAIACARANGVAVLPGDLADPVPEEMVGRVDVLTAVVPYVPTDALHLLPRDVTTYEPRLALDGGEAGVEFLIRAVRQAASVLRPGGSLLLELGGDQGERLAPIITECGMGDVEISLDGEGDLRALFCRR